MAYVFNLMLIAGVFPDKMKRASVAVIHKWNPVDDLNNYRPISVLSVFSKVAERIKNERLISFLNSNKIIVNEKFGF